MVREEYGSSLGVIIIIIIIVKWLVSRIRIISKICFRLLVS